MAYETIKLGFQPGIRKDDSELAAEGFYVSADQIRFKRGFPELIGGWAKLTVSTFTGTVRGGKIWADLVGAPKLAFGTESHLYSYSNSVLHDITPKLTEGYLDTDPFTTTSGEDEVVVEHDGHGLLAGDEVTYSGAETVGGLDLNDTFTVVEVRDASTYTITASGNAGSSGAGGGSAVHVVADLPAGAADASSGVLLRTWSIDTMGESMVALPSGRKLFMGNVLDPVPGSSAANFVTNGDFDTGLTGWAVSAASWTAASDMAQMQQVKDGGGSVTGTSPANLSQNLQANLRAARAYRITFDAGTVITHASNEVLLDVGINAGETPAIVPIMPQFTLLDTSGVMSSYSTTFVCPVVPIDLVFTGTCTANINGTSATLLIDNVVVEELQAAPIDQAPLYSNAMFVDGHGVVVLLGTVETDGDYNPMCVRNSGIQNARDWVADVDSMASEEVLSGGGYLVGGLPTRGQNLIWSDTALFSQQWQGLAGGAFRYERLASTCGLIARHAAIESAGVALWLAPDLTFWIFQGQTPQKINCTVQRDIIDNLNRAQAQKIYCGLNSTHTEAWWFYPRGEETECSHYVAYNWIEDHWTEGEMARTTWIPSSSGFNYPLAFTPGGVIYEQENGALADGEFRTWHLRTGYVDIKDGKHLFLVHRYYPDTAREVGSYTFMIRGKNAPNGAEREFEPAIVENDVDEWDGGISFSEALCRHIQIEWGSGDDSEDIRFAVQRFDVQETTAKS